MGEGGREGERKRERDPNQPFCIHCTPLSWSSSTSPGMLLVTALPGCWWTTVWGNQWDHVSAIQVWSAQCSQRCLHGMGVHLHVWVYGGGREKVCVYTCIVNNTLLTNIKRLHDIAWADIGNFGMYIVPCIASWRKPAPVAVARGHQSPLPRRRHSDSWGDVLKVCPLSRCCTRASNHLVPRGREKRERKGGREKREREREREGAGEREREQAYLQWSRAHIAA